MAHDQPLELIPGARARLERVLAHLSALSDAGHTEVWLVAPSQRAARRLIRELAARRGRALGVRSFTLQSLAEELALPALIDEELGLLPPLGARALAASTLARLAGQLPTLGPQLRDHEGLRRVLAEALGDLRTHAVRPDELRGQAGSPDGSGREPEVARLLEGYEAALARGGHADPADVWTLACERLESDPALSPRPVVLLDPAPAASAEAALCGGLAAWASSWLAVTPPGAAPYEQRLAEAGLRPSPGASSPAESALGRAQRRLFVPHQDPSTPADETLVVRSEPEAAGEASEIVRQVAELGRAGVAYDQVAVLLPVLHPYLAHFQEAFARAELPAFLVPGPPIPEPVGRSLRTLLRVGLEGGSVRRFLEALSLGELSAVTQGVSPTQLETLLVEASIVQGNAARWEQRLGLLQRRRRTAHQEALRQDPDGGHAHRLGRELHALDALRQRTVPLIDALQQLAGRQQGWAAWSHALLALARAQLSHTAPIERRLAELEQLEGLGQVDLPGVLDLLDRDLGISADLPGDASGRVRVLPLGAARGCSFPHVFVPGLIEGAFPSPVHEDPLLFDAIREALRGPSFAARERDRLRERDLLRIAVDAAETRLTLTYPRLDPAEGREPVPSTYLFDLLQAAESWRGGLEALRRRALDSDGARLDHPVPLDPQRAAAPVEYDLAVALAQRGLPHLEQAEDEPGLTVLRRGQHRQRLLDTPALTAADGLVDPPADLAAAIATRSPAHAPVSATGLESFAGCPYAFFLARVVRLRELDEPEPLPELDPLTRGNLIHHTVHRFLVQQGLPLRLRSAELDTLLPALDGVFSVAVAELREEHAVASTLLLDGALAETRRALRRWLRARAEEGDAGWRIVATELAFGFQADEGDPRSQAEPVTLAGGPPTILRGQIDLIEESLQGERRITDLKGGKQRVDADDRLQGGQSLQRPLYALAYAQLVGEAARPTRARLSYLWGQAADVEVVVDDELIRQTQRALSHVHKAFERACFPAVPAPNLEDWRAIKRQVPNPAAPPRCPAYCAFLPVCGRRAADRARHKETDRRMLPVRSIRRQV